MAPALRPAAGGWGKARAPGLGGLRGSAAGTVSSRILPCHREERARSGPGVLPPRPLPTAGGRRSWHRRLPTSLRTELSGGETKADKGMFGWRAGRAWG